jgi:hypothetical protein
MTFPFSRWHFLLCVVSLFSPHLFFACKRQNCEIK